MIRLSDLIGKPVIGKDGGKLGRVEEVHVGEDGVVTRLGCGAGGWIEREFGRGKAQKIDWAKVERVTDRAILLRADAKITR